MANPDEINPLRIEAQPTKELFIHILTKDIPLGRAILDLVDNAVDGARRVRPDRNYEGLSIELVVGATEFSIKDTCGGIPVEIARRYAFRFGRVAETPRTPHSVGQFGVGMKRALFKLGNIFRVESRTEHEHFILDVNVQEWSQDKNPEWHFTFSALEEGLPSTPEGERGTTIVVTQLHDQVAREFALESFRTRLGREISAAHQETLACGIKVSVNTIPLTFEPPGLYLGATLKPAFMRMAVTCEGRPPVDVRIYCGLGVSSPDQAGWYVFCNGRLVIRADQTNLTGWGEENEATMPKYHNQYARFRGFVYFDSDDASLLPWNTTKTGVDQDSPLFVAVRQQMLVLARPVIDFVNRVDSTPDVTMPDVVAGAAIVAPPAVLDEGNFVAPELEGAKRPRTQTISYSRLVSEIDKAKQVLGVTSGRQVGEKTFEYYYRLECED